MEFFQDNNIKKVGKIVSIIFFFVLFSTIMYFVFRIKFIGFEYSSALIVTACIFAIGEGIKRALK